MTKKSFECAEKVSAILLTQVKRKQKTLMNQIKHGCNVQRSDDRFESYWEKHHGRLERGIYEGFAPLPMLKKWQDEWGAIRQVIRVTRYRERLNSTEQASHEISYYVCNRLLPINMAQKAIRSHWSIENRLHYV